LAFFQFRLRRLGCCPGHDLRYVAATVSHTFVAFGELLQLHKRFLELLGYSSRVLELDSALRATHKMEAKLSASSGLIDLDDDSEDCIRFEDLDIVTPTGNRLVSSLTLKVRPKENLLLTGCSGSGKTSIVRTLGDLWPVRGGRVYRPKARPGAAYKTVFLVPQTPYSSLGSLGDQMTYPELSTDALADPDTKARMLKILNMVGLGDMLDRYAWHEKTRWEDVLSLGEQQRLGMARLFYHQPKYAVLDQCTDAVSVDVEGDLYKHAADLGITIITTSQRPALTSLHTRELKLSGDGAVWSVYDHK